MTTTTPAWLATEAVIRSKWLTACGNGTRYSSFCQPSGLGDRVRRLFAVACCRSAKVWPLLKDERSRTAVEVAERYSDGVAVESERRTAYAAAYAAYAADAAYAAANAADAAAYATNAAANAANAAADAAAYAANAAAYAADAANAAADAARKKEWSWQANVWVSFVRPEWAFDAAWRTADAVGMASVVYATRDAGLLPVLADALEESGCEDPRILAWLRSATEFHRGEWIVDHLLGKRGGG